MKKTMIILLAVMLMFATACSKPENAFAQAPQDELMEGSGEPEAARPPKPEEPEYEPLPDEMKPLAEQITGEWFADFAGLAIRLTLREDGSYTLSFPGETPKTGKWETADGLLLLDGNADDAIMPVNSVLYWDSADLLFSREAPQGYIPAEIFTDAKEGAFDGWWKAQFVGVGEGTILAAALDEDTELYIEGTKIAFTGARFGSAIADGKVASGVFAFSAGDASVKLELQSDGFLRLTLDGAEPAVLYLMHMALPEQAPAQNL